MMRFATWLHEVQQQMNQFPNPKSYYLGCKLTPLSHDNLHNEVNKVIGQYSNGQLQNIPPNWNIVCHHMTVKFNLTIHDFEKYAALFGKPVKLQVIGIAADENAVAVKVISNPHLEVEPGKIPHITVAHSSNVTPYYSNTLLKNSKIQPWNMGPFDSDFVAINKNKDDSDWPNKNFQQ
jgi:Fungal tRNA ligase phosphodiesterase domain